VPEDGEAKLKLQLFGAFAAWVVGQPLPPLRLQKGRWLLALLALRQGQEVPRALLAQTLWPDRVETDARTGLRQLLSELRRALGDAADEVLRVTPRTLCLVTADVEVDVWAFDRAIVKGTKENTESHKSHKIAEALMRAVALYGGPLLEECAEPWVVGEREERERRYLQAIERLAALAGAAGDDATEIDTLRRGIAVDPTHEPLHRALLRALARTGDYGGAIQVYQALRQRLHDETHTEPSPELRAHYQQLRAEAERRAKRGELLSTVLATGAAPPIRLPRPLTPMIGREREAQEVMARLAFARLVTLVGTGGAGKTRLAIHVASELAAGYADGVWFIDLSALTAPERLPGHVAQGLGVQEERGRTYLETLIGFLLPKQLLLVLDNCEPLVDACAELVAALLSGCPELRILATSRERLGPMGESVYRLDGLGLPENERAAEASELLRAPAVQLFVQRAQATRHDFAPRAADLRDIAAVCRLLDGLPLAIELAAALVESLTSGEIATRLKAGQDLPEVHASTLPHRHRTLEALMASSYSLLTPMEQVLLRRLAVFHGGWTLAEAEGICAIANSQAAKGQHPPPESRDAPELLSALSRLVAKSLVVSEAREGRSRYRMLDLIRRYAERQLELSGEAEVLRLRHRDHFLQLAEEAARHLTGLEQARWLASLDAAHDNLRAVLWHAEATDGEILLRLVNALGRFWQIRGYWSEGLDWIDRALALMPGEPWLPLRASAANWASLLATYQGNLSRGQDYAARGLALWQSLGDEPGIASALGCLGIVAGNRGDYTAARDHHARSLELTRACGDKSGMAGALGYLGNVAMAQGDLAAAREYYKASLELRRALRDTWGVAASLNNLGLLARHERDWTTACSFLTESLTLRRQLGDRRCIAITLNLLGLCAIEQDDAERARLQLTEGLEHCREIGDRRSTAYALEAFAVLAMLERQPAQAVRLLGAAAALRAAIASPLTPPEEADDVARKRHLRDLLGDRVFAQHWEEGRRLFPFADLAAVLRAETPVC
jgi:predicted ATPase/DNA-binding SARP family transcriptional activator/Tfp pilus assembly protein PilF